MLESTPHLVEVGANSSMGTQLDQYHTGLRQVEDGLSIASIGTDWIR